MIAIVASLLVSGFCLAAFARYASKHADTIELGDRVFRVGTTTDLAKRFAKGGPFFFNDLVVEDGLARPLVLARVSGDDWAALNALPPHSPAACAVHADVKAKKLVDPCTGDAYSYDGLGVGGKQLERFTTDVNRRNVLSVDLNTPYPAALRTQP
jgi:hypothetical protein